MLKRTLLAVTFFAALGVVGLGAASKAEAHGYFCPHRGYVVAYPVYHAPPPVVYHSYLPPPRFGRHHFHHRHGHFHRRGGFSFSIGF
jgi:hypothetical protein